MAWCYIDLSGLDDESLVEAVEKKGYNVYRSISELDLDTNILLDMVEQRGFTVVPDVEVDKELQEAIDDINHLYKDWQTIKTKKAFDKKIAEFFKKHLNLVTA